jgi:anaerobic magnesium-protoporphyrin IX monomethyl ester cyclase
MRVLLIQPPVEDFYQTAIRTQPLGLACLAAALRGHGHDVAILDCQQPGLKRQLPLPAAFSYMNRFYTAGDISPFRLYGRYSHFGISWDAVRQAIAAAAPEALGISCQFTPYVEETLKTAGIVKNLNPAIPVIVGGAHASALPAEVLKSPHIDYVIIGEGERSLPRLIDCLADGRDPGDLAGIAFKRSGEVIVQPREEFIENLDTLPLPARDLLDPSWYGVGKAACAMLLTSRGCPQRCSYCSVHQVMGSRLRCRSAEHVIAEMKDCHDRFGITAFDFEDDNFTFDRERALKIFDGIVSTFGEKQLRLFAMNGLSLISLDPELLQAMKAAGFERLDLSLGSSSQELNRRMDRPADTDRADAALETAARLGLPVTTYIILGMPDHLLEDMVDSMAYLMERPSLLGPSIFYPSPGTLTFDAVRQAGLCDVTQYSLLRSSAFPVETPHCGRLDLVTLLRLCRWINFIKNLLADKGMVSCLMADLPELVAQTPDSTALLTRPLSTEAAGCALSKKLLDEKMFFGIKRLNATAGYRYGLFSYETSRKAIDIFFEKGHSLLVRAPALRES